jgi:hypothetical protein
MTAIHKPTFDAMPPVIEKFGEVSNKKMFQVRGAPHWSTSPQIAVDTYNRLKLHATAGGFQKKDKK